MQSMQSLRTRIRSVNSTRKITKAMEMIANAKLFRQRAAMEANREYAMDAWELGVSGYILKPLTLERVKQELSVLRFPVHGLEE